MEYLFWISVAVSGTISYLIGRKIKSYWSLFPALIVGLLFSGLSVILYFNYGNIERFGLGIIGILVAVIVISSALHIFTSIVGAWVGTYFGRKNLKK